jgi:hypothetical protein
MAADITNDRALGGNLRCSFRTQVGHRARSEKGPGGDIRQSLSARLCTPRPVTILRVDHQRVAAKAGSARIIPFQFCKGIE